MFVRDLRFYTEKSKKEYMTNNNEKIYKRIYIYQKNITYKQTFEMFLNLMATVVRER